MSAEFVRGEIRDGRLRANATKKNHRYVYRITAEQFDEYRSTHWRTVSRGTNSQSNQASQQTN
jgi:hypothetical protein